MQLYNQELSEATSSIEPVVEIAASLEQDLAELTEAYTLPKEELSSLPLSMISSVSTEKSQEYLEPKLDEADKEENKSVTVTPGGKGSWASLSDAGWSRFES